MSLYPFWLTGFDPTSLGSTVPSNSQLLQMLSQSKPAANNGIIVCADSAPDVVTYPDLVNCEWHKTSGGAKTGYLYYYNGTAWTPNKVSPGTLTGASFADASIGIEKWSPGPALYIPQTNAGGTAVVWIPSSALFTSNTFPLVNLSYAAGQNYFIVSGASGDWQAQAKETAANTLSLVPSAAKISTINSLSNDGVVTFQASDGTVKGITHQAYLESLANALPSGPVPATGDLVFGIDVSDPAGFRAKTYSLGNILPANGIAAGTYTLATVTVGANGLVTGISAGSTGNVLAGATAYFTTSTGTTGQGINAITPTLIGLNNLSTTSMVTLASNKLTFAATGTYMLDFSTPIYVDGGIGQTGSIYLMNDTDSVELAQASIALLVNAASGFVRLVHILTVTDITKAFAYYMYTAKAVKLGNAAGLLGRTERYQQVTILRLT